MGLSGGTSPPGILKCFAYVDGGYLRAEGVRGGHPYPNPRSMAAWIIERIELKGIGLPVLLRRVSFYDAESADTPVAELEGYWKFADDQLDTDLRFGEVRGKRKRQKGVDVLLAVDMLSASFRQIFDIAILVAGDADFVPLVNEVRRLGVTVVVAGIPVSMAPELKTACDRFVDIDPQHCVAWVHKPFTPPPVTK